MTTRTPLLGLALLLSLAGAATPSKAAIGTLDDVPAATLLLPYFEVDPAANGQRTVVTLGNASPAETLAHVTLWTDRGVATHSFDVRLPGYGASEVDLRALFANGTVPASTAGGFASCAGSLPTPALTPAQIDGLRNAHRGQASSLLGGQCGGVDHGDTHARGYMTVDVVSACTTLVPGSPGYFAPGGTGIATNANVLWGEQATLLPAQGIAYGDTLVHIEASTTHVDTNGIGDGGDGNGPLGDAQFYDNDYTFYGRLVASAADNREGLPQQYMGKYSLEGAILGTTALVWRDPGAVSAFACGSPPPQLNNGSAAAFDHQEEVSVDGRAIRAGFATQSIDLGDATQSAIPFASGFVHYTLDRPDDATFEGRNQAFIGHVYRSTFGGASQAGVWAISRLSDGFGYIPIGFGQCSDGIDNDGDGNIDFPADGGCASASAQTESPLCSNGVDDDGDGDIDFPADAGCLDAFSSTETTACSNGIDDDGDGLADSLDPGCRAPADQFEDDGFDNACSDGIDNDGDGLIDFSPDGIGDPTCTGPGFPRESNACSDGIDNDGDGLIDFPADLGCFGANDNDEVNAACNNGIDDDGDGFIDFPADVGCSSANDSDETNAACSNGIDDDGDGDIDFPADSGCAAANDPDETNTECDDGIDNDGDGNIDFPADTGCATAAASSESPQCSDGIDNDGDGDTDFPDDTDCAAPSGNTEFPGPVEPQCNDGIDNDGDGLVDFPFSPGCTNPRDTFEGPDCNDGGTDNDRDGLADAADPGCTGPTDWNELSNATTRACSDGIDNDGDGAIDYPDDSGCMSAWDDVEFSPAGIAPEITLQPTTLPDAAAGVPYSQAITASGGTAPYTFLVFGGTLPAGLTLGTDGVLSGTPTEAGAFPLVIEATDDNGFTGSQSYTLVVTAPVIDLTPATLPDGDAGVPYAAAVDASGGTAPYTFAVTAGALPAGLVLGADGSLSGTPTEAGDFAITIEATDANGFTGTRDYVLTVSASLIAVQPTTLPDVDGGVPYSQAITASGGTAPYTFAVVSGALPAGLALAADGTLDGTPTEAGSFDFTIEATDDNGFTGTRAYTLVVSGPDITVTPATLPGAETGTGYEVVLGASGGDAPYSFSVVDGTLPPGLVLAADGTLGGTPTVAGAYAFTIAATDDNGFAGTQAYSLVVAQGTTQPPLEPEVIPAMAPWSLLMLLSLLGSVALVTLRRR